MALDRKKYGNKVAKNQREHQDGDCLRIKCVEEDQRVVGTKKLSEGTDKMVSPEAFCYYCLLFL